MALKMFVDLVSLHGVRAHGTGVGDVEAVLPNMS